MRSCGFPQLGGGESWPELPSHGYHRLVVFEASGQPPGGESGGSGEARRPLIEFLRSSSRSAEDDALLKRAAMLGMAGGAGR